MLQPISSPNTARPQATSDEPLTWRRFLWQALGLGALMFASLGMYLAVLNWRGHAGKDNVTWVEWDEVVPYQPGWVWTYLIPYIIGPCLVGVMRAQTFRWFVPRALAVVFLSLAVFIVFPTQTAPRPPIPSDMADGPTRQLYRWMIEVDEPPANAAPSLHVSLTCLLMLALLRDFPRAWPVWVVGTLIVWLATLYTRQHHIIDVVTGALLCVAVVGLWPGVKGQRSSVSQVGPC
jgi:membrane-associated phospholipid phosphatase